MSLRRSEAESRSDMSGSRSWQAGRRPDGRQAEWARRTGRRSLRESRRFRTAQLAAAIFGLAALIAVGAYLASRYQPISRPALAVVGDPLYRELDLPPNAGADQGHHIDLIRLKDDVGYLFAPVAEPATQDWNLLTADRLLRESRDRLIEISRELPSDERTVVIYCGLLGMTRGGKATLLVGDESGADLQVPASEWIRSLSAAAKETGTRVLMLIDPGSATVSWNQGVLAPDFAAQLESELTAPSLSNVCVILASGPGETSWRISDLPAPASSAEKDGKEPDSSPDELAEPQELGRSVFSYYVVKGLRGSGVDRSGRAIGTADHGPKGNRDGRITADELFAYVHQQVDQWAISHRGERQTVTRIGGRGDFLVGAVTKRPPEPKSVERTVTPASDGSKAGEKVAAGNGNPSQKPTELPAITADRRLTELWRERDRLASSSPPAYMLAPAEWQDFQSRLLAAELRLRIGLVDAAAKLLDEAEGQVSKIAATADELNLGKGFGGTWFRPFLSTTPVRAASVPSPSAVGGKPDAATPKPALPDVPALLDQAAMAPATMPIPNEQAIRDQLASRDAFSSALDWAVAKGSSAHSSEDWAALGRVVLLFPAGELSPELRAIQRLVSASKSWTGTDADSKASLAARVLRMFDRFGRFGLDDPTSVVMCRQILAEGLLATAAAERWLVLASDAEETERQLRRADSAFRNLQQSASAISGARRLQRRLDEQLPQLSEWLASVREREPRLSAEDDRYARLQRLSDDLNALASDAISPESDWGTLQARIDAAWTSAQIDDASGIGADLSTLILGERRLAALLDLLADSNAKTSGHEMISARLRETVAAVDALPLGVSNAIADLNSQPHWADIDGQLQFASLPGLNADRRQQLREALQKGQFSKSIGTSSSESRRWAAGTWQGFWARQVLTPVETDRGNGESFAERSAQLDRAWEAFLDGVAGIEAAKIASRRADLGSAIRTLSENERQSQARSAGNENDASVVIGLFADANSLAGDSIDLRKAWGSLPISVRPTLGAGEPLMARNLGGTLSDSTSIVASGGPSGARLSLHSFPTRGHISLRTGNASNPIDVFLADRRVQGGDFSADAVDPQPTVRFRSALTGEESVIVALIDADQFPLAIQRVRVIPEIAEERWRIRFAVATNRSEVLSDAPEILSLPPRTNKPLSLVPVLEFPAAAPAETVSVEVQQRDDPLSDNWHTVLGPKEFAARNDPNSVLSGDLRRLVLDFSPAPTAPPAGATDPSSPTAGAAPSFSFENGLRFVIRLDGKDLPPREIWPVTFDANRFVSEDARDLGISFEGTPPRIEASITATTNVDPRLPEAVPIELEFDRRLDPLVGEQKATQGFIAPGSGGTLKLFGQIGDAPAFEKLLNSTGGAVSLNIAGIPRAYRWRLRYGQVPDRIQPTESPLELEFVRKAAATSAPPTSGDGGGSSSRPLEVVPVDPTLNAAMIDSKELGDVSLRYFIHQFEDRANAIQIAQPRPRSIIAQRSEPGRQNTLQLFHSDQIVRRFATRMNATVTGAVWSVSVESEPHVAPMSFSAVGRFEVTIVLREPGKADVTSESIRLVIDGTPPLVPRFLSPIPGGAAIADRPLPVICSTSDAESGIRSIELRIDADGSGAFEPEKDAVKRFGEADLASDATSDPWYRDGEVKVRWDVPVQLLPPEPAAGKLDRVTIWAVAENRQGIRSEAPPLRLELKRAKRKPPPPPPTTGDIVLTVKPKPRPPVAPEIVLVGPDGATERRSGTSATFNKLKPGQYEIRVTQGSTGFKGQGEAKITVEAGKTSTVNIQVE